MSSKDTNEKRVIHLESDNLDIMIGKKIDEVINKHFESLLSRYQIGLKESAKGNDYVFDCVDLLYYKCHKISLNSSE